MAESAPVDRETFLSRLSASGLLEGPEYTEVVAGLPPDGKPKALARHLIKTGVLTQFQAERIYAGLTNGFVIGQYRVLDLIGKGGMGRVFKAEHRTMRRVVALKLVSSKYTRSKHVRELFLREVRAAARLNHRHIVTSFDAGEHEGRCFLVMEFIDGPNLQQMVKRYGTLPIDLACDVIRQAAEGLKFAHDLGFVHRDIKPANFLLQPSEDKNRPDEFTVKILDFGLARIGEPTEPVKPGQKADDDSIFVNPWTVNGTPDYLSPEQSSDVQSADARSDIYSLGCTLYFMLTGQVPFPGGDVTDKLVRHRSVMPPHVEQVRPEVPRLIGSVVRKMMAKDPKHRFQSADEVLSAMIDLETPISAEVVRVESRAKYHSEPPAPGDSGVLGPSPWSNLYQDQEDAIVSAQRTQTYAGGATETMRMPRRESTASPWGFAAGWMIGALMGVGGTLAVLWLTGQFSW